MGFDITKLPLTKKRIFTCKLKGEPIDVLRDNIGKEYDFLIDNGICDVNLYMSPRLICRYPMRIWFFEGPAGYRHLNKDCLNPGDTYYV